MGLSELAVSVGSEHDIPDLRGLAKAIDWQLAETIRLKFPKESVCRRAHVAGICILIDGLSASTLSLVLVFPDLLDTSSTELDHD